MRCPTRRQEPVHILSPFDPLIIQRKRLTLFFGYDHRFEAYVPKEKRGFGYFALPVLVGDDIVAALDLKTDRAAGKLLIQQWTWIGRGSPDPTRRDRGGASPLRALPAGPVGPKHPCPFRPSGSRPGKRDTLQINNFEIFTADPAPALTTPFVEFV